MAGEPESRLQLAGIKCVPGRAFQMPWAETTDMQARPGARRIAISRKFPATVFLCPLTTSFSPSKLVRLWHRIDVESVARMQSAPKNAAFKRLMRRMTSPRQLCAQGD